MHQPRRIALAAAALLMSLSTGAARAAVTVTGPWFANPAVAGPLDGPHLFLPSVELFIAGANGSFSALAGSQVDLGSFYLGFGGPATGVLDGAGTVMRLHSPGHLARLTVGAVSAASLTVSGGALLDGRADAALCQAGGWCGAWVGDAAGSSGLLTVTGAGSEVRLMGLLQIAGIHVDGSYGTAGAKGQGEVRIAQGGVLRTQALLAGDSWISQGNGLERSEARLSVQGAGSAWWVDGNTLGNGDAVVQLAAGARASADLQVLDGGSFIAQAQPGRHAQAIFGAGGSSSVQVGTAGSLLALRGETATLVVGNDAGGSSTLTLREDARLLLEGSSDSALYIGQSGSDSQLGVFSRAQLGGARRIEIGRADGTGRGVLNVAGSGSRVDMLRDGGTHGQIHVNHGNFWLTLGAGASAFGLEVGAGSGSGIVNLDGSGSLLSLHGLDWHRLGLERGSLMVSGGAVLDAAADAAACAGRWCGAFLGNNAGADLAFTVTGAGSQASFLSTLIAGGSYVTAPPATGYSLGQPGASSRISIAVLDGGLLQTQAVNLGFGPQGAAALGSEAANVTVKLDGAGSVWRVNPSTAASGTGATFFITGLAGGAHSQVSIDITRGARLELLAGDGQVAELQLARDGGNSLLSLSGAGSTLAMSGGAVRTLRAGRNQGQASVVLMDGARLTGLSSIVLGQGAAAASGYLSLDGPQTRGELGGDQALLRLGEGGWGMAQLSRGAQLSLDGSRSAMVILGAGSLSNGVSSRGSGVLQLSDAGTRLDIRTGGGLAVNNPLMSVGQTFGVLAVVDGAVLSLHGGLASTAAQPLHTTLTVGSSQTLAGKLMPGSGFLTVLGAGSRVEVAGADPRVLVGMNGGLGSASVEAGAVLATSYVGVGGNGGDGQLAVNAARVDLSGQWTSQLLGPRLAIGFGSGSTGLVTLTNGAEVVLDGRGGPDRAALVLGGVISTPLGSGRLVASGGASVTLLGAGSALFGQTGSGIGDFSGGSRLDLDGGTLFVGRHAGASGELHLREASQAHAGTVLVGASAPGVDGGQGWLQVTGGSVLHANRLDIGSAGLLSGSGLIDVGLITNRGSINPGDSPGTLQLGGDFVNEAGGRLVLEIESDGHGGFMTDRLVFAKGARVDLGAAQIEFRFLGTTDPNAFQASGGFRIDSFLSQGDAPLDHGLLGGVSYAASSSAYQFTSFTFSADGGATFSAQPVPEPGTWVLFVLGLAVTGRLQRQRPRP